MKSVGVVCSFVSEYLVKLIRLFIMTICGRLLFKERTFILSLKILRFLARALKKKLRNVYSAESAAFLTKKIVKVSIQDFEGRYLFNRMLVEAIRKSLIRSSWSDVQIFLEKKCLLRREADKESCDFIFCTHTGDYWILILTLARSFEGKNIDLVVPIYDKIDDEMQTIYDKVDILGVNIIFMCVHEEGALTRLIRYMKKKNVIVTVFYDLSCYISGVYNGAVDNVHLLGKKGFMTTGIIRIAYKFHKRVSFASCHFSTDENVFSVNLSPVVELLDYCTLKYSMVAYLENFLREFPYQWHFINNLDTYFHYPYFYIIQNNKSKSILLKRIHSKYTTFVGGGE